MVWLHGSMQSYHSTIFLLKDNCGPSLTVPWQNRRTVVCSWLRSIKWNLHAKSDCRMLFRRHLNQSCDELTNEIIAFFGNNKNKRHNTVHKAFQFLKKRGERFNVAWDSSIPKKPVLIILKNLIRISQKFDSKETFSYILVYCTAAGLVRAIFLTMEVLEAAQQLFFEISSSITQLNYPYPQTWIITNYTLPITTNPHNIHNH